MVTESLKMIEIYSMVILIVHLLALYAAYASENDTAFRTMVFSTLIYLPVLLRAGGLL